MGTDATSDRRLTPDFHEPQARRRTIQSVASLALLFTLGYLIWRTVATINPDALWVSIPLLLLEFHAAAGLALHTLALWHVDSLPPPAAVDTTDHRIAVLIPTYNEPEAVLLPTIASAVALEPAHETWVLDDGDRDWVRELASQLGARYLTRPDNSHAKAGNLNHALSRVDADLVAVFDADHVVKPNFLRHTLGYFDDPALALVQTPQAFYNKGSFEEMRSWLPRWRSREEAGFHEQELFYRVISPAKNRWGSPFWCGTSAIIRVEALAEVGGVATESVTEDIQTTIRLHRAGWRTAFHNEVLATGLAAMTAEQYTVQRNRWCTGAMQVLRTERPFTGSGLTLAQRLTYAATILGWFDSWRTLGYVLLPMAVLATGASPIHAPWQVFVPIFVVTLLIQQISIWLLARGRSRPLPATVFELVRLGPVLGATLAIFSSRNPAFRVTPKGRSENGRERARPPRMLALLVLGSFLAAGWYSLTLSGVTPTAYDTPWVAHGAFLWLVFNGALLGAAVSRVISEHFAGDRRASHRFEMADVAYLGGRPCTLLDVSLTGARVIVGARHGSDLPSTGTLGLQIDPAGPKVQTRVRGHDLRGGGSAEFRLEFCGPHVDKGPIALWVFWGRRDALARAARPGERGHAAEEPPAESPTEGAPLVG